MEVKKRLLLCEEVFISENVNIIIISRLDTYFMEGKQISHGKDEFNKHTIIIAILMLSERKKNIRV